MPVSSTLLHSLSLSLIVSLSLRAFAHALLFSPLMEKPPPNKGVHFNVNVNRKDEDEQEVEERK